MRSTFLRSISVFVFLLLLSAPVAMAQGNQQEEQQEQPAMPPQDIEVTDQEMDAVAEVYLDIDEIRRDYQAQLSQVEDPEQARDLQQQLQAEATQAIEDYEGLTVDRYDQIVRAAQTDQELNERLLGLIQEKTAAQQGQNPQEQDQNQQEQY